MAQAKAQSAQEFLPIEEIRDGIVLLKDGTMKIVLMASSLNFALKSAEEQEAIIFQYQNFLNSLDFSVQFFIQSRRLNINPHLDTLREVASAQPNELLKIQTNEYIQFVKNFVCRRPLPAAAFPNAAVGARRAGGSIHKKPAQVHAHFRREI